MKTILKKELFLIARFLLKIAVVVNPAPSREYATPQIFAIFMIPEQSVDEPNMKVFLNDNFCTIYKLRFAQLQKYLTSHGLTIVSRPDEADIVVSGVCAAFDADEARSVSILQKNSSFQVPHYAIGCLVGVNPVKVTADHYYPTWDFAGLARDLTGVASPDYDNSPLPSQFRSPQDYRVYDASRRFVGVTTGCGFECSFCPHKAGAGGVRSRPVAAVVKDVLQAIAEGAKIIHLTGLDTASYGKDFGTSFGHLLKEVLQTVHAEVVFHVAQFNPEGLAQPEDFAVLSDACHDRRVIDFQLPVQTASRRLLGLMKRNYELVLVERFIGDIRKFNREIFFRTDLMVGFPTETWQELQETIVFVSPLFNEAAVYSYERKNGTPIASIAAELEISPEDKRHRVEEMSSALRRAGLLVHSGGQKLSSLMIADKAKAAPCWGCPT